MVPVVGRPARRRDAKLGADIFTAMSRIRMDIDQHVNALKPRHKRTHELTGCGMLREIPLKTFGFASLSVEVLPQALGLISVAMVVEPDPGAMSGKEPHHAGANSARGSRDQDSFVLQAVAFVLVSLLTRDPNRSSNSDLPEVV